MTYLNHFHFFENAENLGRSDDAKRRKKKDDGLMKQIALPWLILIYKIEKGIN